MSKNWVQDIANMHEKFGVNNVVANFSPEQLNSFLKFRLDFILEELKESYKAAGYELQSTLNQVKLAHALTEEDAEEVVDGLIDISVVAIGTLDVLQVDSYKAWDSVLNANMAKEVGIKPSRPNKLGLPDLVKPVGWCAPSHTDNCGLLSQMFGNNK